MKPFVFAAAVLLLATQGCSCFVPAQEAVPAGPVEQLLVDVVAATACGQPKACGTAAPDAACADLIWGQRFGLQPGFAALLHDAADAGRVRFDLDGGAACIAAMQTQCDVDCWPEAAWTGLVPVGGACTQGFECMPGAWCALTDVCPGRCTAKSGAGVLVATRDACSTAAWAQLKDGRVRCLDRIPDGGDCASASDEVPNGRWCAAGLGCAANVCRPLLSPGAACGTEGVCGPGAVCAGTPRTCTRWSNVGGPCGVDLPCLAGLTCQLGKCAKPTAGAGQACDRGQLCARPAACDSQTGTCTTRSASGGPCTKPADCGDYRDVCLAGACRPPRGRGEPCAAGGECVSGLGCRDGVCKAPCAN